MALGAVGIRLVDHEALAAMEILGAAALFGVNTAYLTSSSPLSIAISVLICAVAAFNFLMDFYFIDEMTSHYAAPKYMEWYAAFGLMVTLIWLYMEILRLLSKLQRR